MASFMGKMCGRAKFDQERIVITTGVTATDELLTLILADPVDALLIPTPYYPRFRDLRWRTGVNVVPIHCDSSNGFKITLPSLDSAYSDAELRGVLITNPLNPLGATVRSSRPGATGTPRDVELYVDLVAEAAASGDDVLDEFTTGYIDAYRERLLRRCRMIVDGLGRAGIE
ncbi:1-aminocyclopropane-1-carboxylate synthase 7 [Salvia divinorum]|uniref:1-aminocyclopropane-1-carboxylate synthase 7 n=1 Tax=Salvia divinorum TaxID=28513 RepID=A0ABD1GUR5_SALDI